MFAKEVMIVGKISKEKYIQWWGCMPVRGSDQMIFRGGGASLKPIQYLTTMFSPLP